MKKRIVWFVVCLMMTVGLVACGGGDDSAAPAPTGSVTVSGDYSGTFVPYSRPTSATAYSGYRTITWANTAGDVLFVYSYTPSTGIPNGINVHVPGGTIYYETRYNNVVGGVSMNMAAKTVTFNNAVVTASGGLSATLNGTLYYN